MRDAFYSTPAGARFRARALRKFGPICETCGTRPGEDAIIVGHVVPVSERPDLSMSMNNVKINCAECLSDNPPYPGALGFWAGKPWYTPEEFLDRLRGSK